MAETKHRVPVHMVDYICDRCGEGKMLAYGNFSYMTYPPLYPHKCERCNYQFNFRVQYPRLVFGPEDDSGLGLSQKPGAAQNTTLKQGDENND